MSQRTILGLIAVALLLGGLSLWLAAAAQVGVVGLGMIRLGIMFAVVWLAIPNFQVIFARFPPWLIATTLAGIVLVLWQRQFLLLVLPVLIVLWVIVPRWFAKQEKP